MPTAESEGCAGISIAEWAFVTYGQCGSVYGVLRTVQSVSPIGTSGVML